MAAFSPALTLPRARTLASAPLTVATCVLLLWSSWYILFFLQGHDARDLILVSDDTIHHSSASTIIRIDPSYHYHAGYDGEFAYFIALDPLHAAGYLDKPNYRYTRILYPMTARLLALGQPALIPYTLILVNLLAMVLGTLIAARWLVRHHRTPWLALLFGCAPGLVVGMQYDLNEPLAYLLALLGITLLYTPGARPRWVLAGLAFAAASLTREVTLIIPLVLVLTSLLRPQTPGDRAHGLQFAALSFTPFLLYKLVLFWWVGPAALPADVLPAFPFMGYLASHPRFPLVPLVAAIAIIAPALLVGSLAAWAWWQGRGHDGLLLALIIQVIYLVVLLPSSSAGDMISMTRVTAAIPVATLVCLPQIMRLMRNNRLWLTAAISLWGLLLPWLFTNWLYW